MERLVDEKGHTYPYNVIPSTRSQFRFMWAVTTQGNLWPVVAEDFKDDPDDYDMYVAIKKEKASSVVQGLIESELAVPIPEEVEDVLEYLIEKKAEIGIHITQDCLRYLNSAMSDGEVTTTKRVGICFQILLKLASRAARETRELDLCARKRVMQEWLQWYLDRRADKMVSYKEAAVLSENQMVTLIREAKRRMNV